LHSVILFVQDINAVTTVYEKLLNARARRTEHFNVIATANGAIGFHPADAKCPDGTVVPYIKTNDLDLSIEQASRIGFDLFRGPLNVDSDVVAQIINSAGLRIGLIQTK
jgi:predicted enzyme related to lactoylglutathione lyase